MLSASIRATERRFSTIIRVDLPSAPEVQILHKILHEILHENLVTELVLS